MTIIELYEGVGCPTCGRDDFKSEAGMKRHHLHTHGESISGALVECNWCGDRTRKDPYEAKQYDRHFCNKKCRGRWHAEDHSYRLVDWTWVMCDWCSIEFELPPSIAKRAHSERNFCSPACHSEWRSEFYSGEDNPNWSGGYSGYYGSNWRRQRQETLLRDDFVCQNCEMTRDEHKELTGQDLHVHHRKPIRTFDEPEQGNTLENLTTLCSRCHRRIEAEN